MALYRTRRYKEPAFPKMILRPCNASRTTWAMPRANGPCRYCKNTCNAGVARFEENRCNGSLPDGSLRRWTCG